MFHMMDHQAPRGGQPRLCGVNDPVKSSQAGRTVKLDPGQSRGQVNDQHGVKEDAGKRRWRSCPGG